MDHGHDHGVEEGMTIKTFKIWMLFAIWLCVLAGLLPKVIPAVSRNEIVLSFLNCFSAGIFLGMALLHIIPEGVEIYEGHVEKEHIEKPFPWPYVLIFAGYLLVLVIDRVIAGWLLKLMGKEHEAHIGHSHGSKTHHDHHKDDPQQVKVHNETDAATPDN